MGGHHLWLCSNEYCMLIIPAITVNLSPEYLQMSIRKATWKFSMRTASLQKIVGEPVWKWGILQLIGGEIEVNQVNKGRKKSAFSENQICQGECPYHSVPVPVVMRREGKQQLFRAVWCVNHELITGSKTERTTSAVVNNFHAEAPNRQGMSFVTSASWNASQNELVRKFTLLLFNLRKLATKGLEGFDILKAFYQTDKMEGLEC